MYFLSLELFELVLVSTAAIGALTGSYWLGKSKCEIKFLEVDKVIEVNRPLLPFPKDTLARLQEDTEGYYPISELSKQLGNHNSRVLNKKLLNAGLQHKFCRSDKNCKTFYYATEKAVLNNLARNTIQGNKTVILWSPEVIKQLYK